MRVFLSFLLLAGVGFAQELPITGLAHVGFRVSDLEKARGFYTGVLGYQQAFELKNKNGGTALAFFKINDDQYIEISPNLQPGQDDRLTHIAMLTPDIEKLHRMLAARGLAPPPIGAGRDGNRNFSLEDPDGHRIEFVQYMPGSLHTRAHGKFLDGRRISDHLLHAGVTVADEAGATAFYRDKLGFLEIWRGGPTAAEVRWINMRMPGPRGDYVEFMLYSKPPTRQQLGSMHHICLDVPEIQAGYRTAVERGVPNEERYKPRIGRNRRWLMNLFDPDGTRTELMEPRTVD
jgi:catechol 2,3-dioxygenase-like lactoylglutathione lyase family enzyme